MRSKKGQISIEYTAIIASLLVILILLIAIFGGIYSQEGLHTQQIDASHALSVLATDAKVVWEQGNGSYMYQKITIPESAYLQNSSIGNKTLRLYVLKLGDSFQILDLNVSGWWPNQTGAIVMAIRNNGSQVLIRPAALISVSKTGFYFNVSSTSGNISITNSANETYDISQSLNFAACPSCTYDKGGVTTLAPGSIVTGTLTIPSLSPGRYAGYLEINATTTVSGSQFENVTYEIPITVLKP